MKKELKNMLLKAILILPFVTIGFILSPLKVSATTLQSNPIYHIHTNAGVSSSDTQTGCYTNPTTAPVTELCHYVKEWDDAGNPSTYWTCSGCGEQIHEYPIGGSIYAPNGQSVGSWSASVRDCSYSSTGCHANPYDRDESGYKDFTYNKTTYNCPHDGENLGTVNLTRSGYTLTVSTTSTKMSLIAYSWTVPSGVTSSTTSSVTATANGTYRCVATVKDAYSGVTSTTTLQANITDCIAINSITKSTADWTTSLTININATNASSYSIDGTHYQTSNVFTITENGTYTAYAKNNYGNVATKNITITNIDKTAPTLSISVSGLTCTVSVQDNASLLKVVETHDSTPLSSTNVSGTSSSLTFSLVHGVYEYTVYDKAGNTETFSTAVYYIDETASLSHVHSNKGTSPCYTSNALSCSHDNESMGSMTLIKTCLNGTCTLSFDSSLTHASISSYAWSTSETSESIETTAVGTYICNVTYTDAYSSNQGIVTFTHTTVAKDYYKATVTGYSSVHNLLQDTTGFEELNSLTLTCTTSGETTIEYQWYANGVLIPNATSSTYIAFDYGTYYCMTTSQTGQIAQSNSLTAFVGKLHLEKYADGAYKLKLADYNVKPALTISYLWSGADNSLTTHLNGASPSDINGQTSNIVTITDYGTYTCAITLYDAYLDRTYTCSREIEVNDFDITAPKVETIQDLLYVESLDNVNDVFKEKENTTEPFVTAYKESTKLTLALSDNFSLEKLVSTGTNLNYTKNLSRGLTETVDITFTQNGVYTFSLFDTQGNIYNFSIEIKYLDNDNPVVATHTSTPDYTVKSASYTLQVASTDYSKMYYKWLRKDLLTNEIGVYKDWSDEAFVKVEKNGAYACLVADSVYYNDSETEPTPTKDYLSAGGHKHITPYNLNFNDPTLNYYYCDTIPPEVDYELRPTPKFVIVTILATDNQDKPEDLKYTCDKNIKQDKNIFYVTQNGTYKYTVTDTCGNSSSVSVYIDFDALTGNQSGIIKDLNITPLGTHVEYEGITYSNTGFIYEPVYKDFVDTNFILTKWNSKGQYKKILSYTVEDNSSDVLYSRYTKDETANTGQIEYQTKITTIGVDKVAPTLSIDVSNKIATITASDKLSGVGKIEVETMTTSSKDWDYVSYDDKRNLSVSYALPMELNTIYGIKIYDNVGNESMQYYVSTDGVLTGSISNLYVVIFVDGFGKQISEQYLIKGANAVAPDSPLKEGYTFVKWSCDFTNVKSNLLVYPVYKSNVTGLILDEKINYDKSLRTQLKDSAFMFSTGGTGELDESKVEIRTITDDVFVQDFADRNGDNGVKTIIDLSDAEAPKAYFKEYVYKYSGLSLLILLIIILVFKEWQERKRIN